MKPGKFSVEVQAQVYYDNPELLEQVKLAQAETFDEVKRISEMYHRKMDRAAIGRKTSAVRITRHPIS